MSIEDRERREAHIAGGEDLHWARKRLVPAIGEPEEVDREALATAVAMLEPDAEDREQRGLRPYTARRTEQSVRKALTAIMAKAPSPPLPIMLSKGLPIEDRLANLETQMRAWQSYTLGLRAFVQGPMVDCLVMHIEHLEIQTLVDFLNGAHEAEIKFYAREVAAEREHDYRKIISDAVSMVDVLIRMAARLKIDLQGEFGVSIQAAELASGLRLGTALKRPWYVRLAHRLWAPLVLVVNRLLYTVPAAEGQEGSVVYTAEQQAVEAEARQLYEASREPIQFATWTGLREPMKEHWRRQARVRIAARRAELEVRHD